MTDDQYGLALRAWLGLPTLPEGSRCICKTVGPLLPTSGDHVFGCNNSCLRGGRTITHAAELRALEGFLNANRTRSNGAMQVVHDPSLRDRGFTPKVAANVGADGNAVNSRGDALVIDNTRPLDSVIVDVVVSAVSCHSAAASVTAGAASDAARLRKITQYNNLWVLGPAQILPFSIEDGGRIEPTALTWLKAYVRASRTRAAYAKSLSFELQRISVALQRAIATRRRTLNLVVRPLGAAPAGA